MLVMAFAPFSLLSSDNNNAKNEKAAVRVDRYVEHAFRNIYPMASEVNWIKQKSYYVADFFIDQNEMMAWFDKLGIHYMSMTCMQYDGLPEEVKATFSSGEYTSWNLNEVNLVERQGKEILYSLAVALKEQKYNLCYTSDGSLKKVIANINNAHLSLLEIEKEADKSVDVYAYTINVVVE